MKYVEVVTDKGSSDTIVAIAEKSEVSDVRISETGKDGMQSMRLLVADDKIQSLLDSLQKILHTQPTARVVVMPVEIVLPIPSEKERKKEDAAIGAREALYEGVEKNAHLDLNFVILVVLSTIVAAIGLIEDNVAVVIGAMVIAPLLGPNLAFGLGTALGDISLMRKSALTTAVGVLIAVALSYAIGVFWPFDYSSPELAARSRVGLDSVALALASGAAAALSLTTGLSSVLVGVMVAVALLPPAVALGIMLGIGENHLAFLAGLLLSINVVCVNLAIKVVFFFKGIRPRTWWEKKKATRAMVIYIMVWIITLIVLVFFIYGHQSLVN
jgi:uncharacterized hydrophobic protein (TIGR00341 family)